MAENLQEYYKRMAEAIDTQLEQKGKAALFYPVGSGSGRIVWAWINAHPDAAVIWVVPGETRRRMRLEEAKRIGQEIPPRVQLINCEDNTPQRCLELAKIRPACIILDGSREFTAFPCGERVRWLQRFSPQAKLLGLIDTDQPVSCCLAEAMFQGAGTFSISLAEALARGLVTPPAVDTVLLWPAETALEEFRIQMKQWNAAGVPGVGEKVFTNLRRAVEKCGPALPRLREALPKGKQLVLCEDAAAMRRVTENLEALFGPDTEATILKDGWDQEMAVRFAASPARGAGVLVTVSTPGGLARLAGMAGAVLVRSTGLEQNHRRMLARALALCGGSAPLVELNVSFAGLRNAEDLVQGTEQAGGTGFPLEEPYQACIRPARQLQRQLDAQWEQAFAAAKEAAAKGDINELPRGFTTEAGFGLGRWLELQRQIQAGEKPGRLTAEQAARLEKLGIAWKQRMEQAWERGYAAAREYRGEYGNLMVPVRYRDKNGFALGEWIVYNRQRFLGNNLSTDRVERLEALGMVWDTVQDIWEQSYCAAVQYWLDHGTLEVPVKYTTPEGVALGVWLGSQRAAYKAGTIKPVQKAWLEALDVDWTNRNDRKWQAAYDAAARYYQAHGDLNVPSEYIDPDGVLLGKWVSRQRYAWQNPDRSSARLTPERKALLDQLGMVWQKPDSWQHRYELAAAYKAAHGSLELPAQYRTEEGIWLGSWLSRQKQLLQKGDKSLSGERAKALKELFRGEPERRSGAVRTRARCSVRERNWLNNYRHAKAYAKRRGDLLVPASYVDETGFRLGVWISNLRAARKTRPDSFQVTPEHIAMLDEIGMQWDAREAKWQCALRRAGEYRAAHGDLTVPVNYKTEDGFCLGDWIRRMRESYAAHDARLTPERVENLSALGMVWAPAEG